jgi:hypothetical protein
MRLGRAFSYTKMVHVLQTTWVRPACLTTCPPESSTYRLLAAWFCTAVCLHLRHMPCRNLGNSHWSSLPCLLLAELPSSGTGTTLVSLPCPAACMQRLRSINCCAKVNAIYSGCAWTSGTMGPRAAVIWWHYIKLTMEFTMMACTRAETLGIHMMQLLCLWTCKHWLHTNMRARMLLVVACNGPP